MTQTFSIGETPVGLDSPCFIIAEVAQAHDGSLGIAHSFIDAVAATGANAIKFQTHIAHAESTPEEQFRINFSYEDASRYEYWQRMEFTPEQWAGLVQHAQEKGLVFLSSAFSVAAVELLDRLGMPAWKIGSGEVNNDVLLNRMVQTQKPILLSTGMSEWQEITSAVQHLQTTKVPLALFQCTSKYPTPLTDVGLNVLHELRQRFNVPVGLSDHSGTLYPALAAMAQGVDLLEFHVTFDRMMFGPDAPASLTFAEVKQLVDARDAFHTLHTSPVDKDAMATELRTMKQLFNKSVALVADQPANTLLTLDMLTTKKPGTGIPARDLNNCVGKRLKHDCTHAQLLSWDDFA